MPAKDRKGGPSKYRNISVDADLVETINQRADELEPFFGFRPSISQTIRYTFKKESK